MTHWLAGYDIKLRDTQIVAAEWDDERRRIFLLRRDVAWPVSVDANVSRSVFIADSEDIRHPYEVACRAAEPTDFSTGLSLWRDYDAMVRAYEGQALEWRSRTARIAVVLPQSDAQWQRVFAPQSDESLEERVHLHHPYSFENLHRVWTSALEQPEAWREPDGAGWSFLGYDVADGYMTSGVSNCGYSEADRADAVTRAFNLNDYGLVDGLPEALKFRDWTDARVPEHAPYFVYGVYLAI